MRYAVIFETETNNTEALAEEIYRNIDSTEKVYVNLNKTAYIPDADVYFVGFPVRNHSCSLKVIDCIESITEGKIALFATCGMRPTSKYKDKMEDSIRVWIPDSAEYLDMFLCQGRMSEKQKDYFYQKNVGYKSELQEMFTEGDHHPDDDDLDAIAEFAQEIQERIE